MDRYKFRGKRLDNGEWVEGNLIGKSVIVGEIVEWDSEYFCTEFWVKVDPATVGQYTGLKDKNGKEIYEGDIVKGHRWKKGEKIRHIGEVKYIMNGFEVVGIKQYKGLHDELNPTYRVLGNVHDNPELLEG